MAGVSATFFDDFFVEVCVRGDTHIVMNRSASPLDVEHWLEGHAAKNGPAILGSLSLRRSPCIRENCQACLSGEQHPSWVLYGRVKRGDLPSMFPTIGCRRYAAVWTGGVRCRRCCMRPHRDTSKL